MLTEAPSTLRDVELASQEAGLDTFTKDHAPTERTSLASTVVDENKPITKFFDHTATTSNDGDVPSGDPELTSAQADSEEDGATVAFSETAHANDQPQTSSDERLVGYTAEQIKSFMRVASATFRREEDIEIAPEIKAFLGYMENLGREVTDLSRVCREVTHTFGASAAAGGFEGKAFIPEIRPDTPDQEQPEENSSGESDQEDEDKEKENQAGEKKLIPEVYYRAKYYDGRSRTTVHTIPGEQLDLSYKLDAGVDATHVLRATRKIHQYRTHSEIGRTTLKIFSPHITNALRVIQCYPKSLGLPIGCLEPYRELAYYVDDLESYREKHPDHDDMDITMEHIGALVQFLRKSSCGHDLEIGAKLNGLKTPATSFATLWTIFVPGCDVYTNDPKPQAFVVKKIKYGPDNTNKTQAYSIKCWNLVFDSSSGVFRRNKVCFQIPYFQGQKEIRTLKIYPARFDNKGTGDMLIERGKKFWDFTMGSPLHVEYSGATFDTPPITIHGRAVIDSSQDLIDDYSFMAASDPYDALCRCTRCQTSRDAEENPDDPKSRFQSYEKLSKGQDPTPHQYSLLDNQIPGWILKDHKWVRFDVDCARKVEPDREIFQNLILPEGRTEIVKALVQTHVMQNPEDGKAGIAPYFADVIKGKGQGLLILLHGAPGVGKTSTAECVAEYTGRPLFPITCGGIGIEPNELERKLETHFKMAQHFNAVLLLDEADVFLEKREINELKRNSLVSVFLRVLEYYEGILFLTTNRVGTFDEAFTSRLHAIVYYPPLTEEYRRKIWKNHLDRLEAARPDITIPLNFSEYIESPQLNELQFNGRQIRNLFQTAVGLAIYNATAKATEQKPAKAVLTVDCLKRVVQLSTDFKQYLESFLGEDSWRMKAKEVREDTFNPGTDRQK